ncbi:MAG: hypothetical protein HGB02_01725 [Chlorobiaceae bacterium]|nr:hypothetical protein [Chlorobiaceae bacterium]
MTELPKKPVAPSAWIWIGVTLLWGTVFFMTSTFMLTLSVRLLGQGTFDPAGAEVLGTWLATVPVLVAVALAAMVFKELVDPGSRKQIERHQAVARGVRERYFVSFAGSIATSFLFTVLTAVMHMAAAPLTGSVVELPARTIVLAASINIAAGLSASMLVGIVFMVARAVRGSRS